MTWDPADFKTFERWVSAFLPIGDDFANNPGPKWAGILLDAHPNGRAVAEGGYGVTMTDQERLWYAQGQQAYKAGVARQGNQHEFGTRAYTCWQTGWLDADYSPGSSSSGVQHDHRGNAEAHDREYHGGQFNQGEW